MSQTLRGWTGSTCRRRREMSKLEPTPDLPDGTTV
jgi:hypothetical protein